MTGNDYSAKNDDPLVNHLEHNHDFSFAAQIIPTETLSLDFNYAHDDVFSVTDLCYVYVATATAPLPPGAVLPQVPACVLEFRRTLRQLIQASQLYLGNGYYDAPRDVLLGLAQLYSGEVFPVQWRSTSKQPERPSRAIESVHGSQAR